ncbi:MAG: helix-turn-helix domain-containing protein [Actinomycetota bacterium]|nr:helix-turn-helix domain-containing protein [Actinomycetota bacterium]
MSRRGTPITQQDLDRARTLLQDGASQREVTRTTGISRMTLRKYFPGQCWTFKDGGDFRALTKSAEVKIRRAA